MTDIDDLVEMDRDPEVRRYITPDFRDRFDAKDYRESLTARVESDPGQGLGCWTLRKSDPSNRFCGMCLLIPVGLEGPEIEVGWRLPKWAWGNGYASEAAARVLRYAFEDLGLVDVIACIDPENARSTAVASRLGFSKAGRKTAYGTEFDLYRKRQDPGDHR